MSQRLLKEYRELRGAKRDQEIDLRLADESDITEWAASLQGPSGTPYEGGTFEIYLKCLDNYPLVPPSVKFVTPIFHPNVMYTTGEICLDILKPDAWTPAWTLQSVCRAVLALLSDPQADSPLNCDCGALRLAPAPQRARARARARVSRRPATRAPAARREPDPERRHEGIPLDGAHVHSAPRHQRGRRGVLGLVGRAAHGPGCAFGLAQHGAWYGRVGLRDVLETAVPRVRRARQSITHEVRSI